MLCSSLRPFTHLLVKPRTAILTTARRNLLTLAIETSCDDTCVAILSEPSLKDDTLERTAKAVLHFNEKVTLTNAGHGGIHPLEALESHHATLAQLVDRSLTQLPEPHAKADERKTITLRDRARKQKPDFISVTQGPGMRSNLSCGLGVAKGLSTAWQVPLVGVHHMQAHALTPRLVHSLQQTADSQNGVSANNPQPRFPFLTLLVSGGHTLLVHSTSLLEHQIVAESADIAIGDCLDKCGRDLMPACIISQTTDTSYAKHLSTFAFPTVDTYQSYAIPRSRADELKRPSNSYGWSIKVPLSDTRDMRFAFSSIYTNIASLTQAYPNMSEDERIALARTALGTAFEHLGSRTIIALQSLSEPLDTLVVSGGVAANSFLRYFLRQMLDLRGFKSVKLVFPPVKLCTDNAAMIAWAGMEMFEAGYESGLGIMAKRKWPLDELKQLGVKG